MGKAPCCDKANVRRGPWSPEEDAILKDYLQKYGNGGNWISLPHKTGLKRCGKSCRLRWLNYLRPNIKHGGFTPEEDNIICNLYSSIGSRWSTIASHLPGRTDNDVKNYWNTKLKKRLKMTGRINAANANANAESSNHNITINENNGIMEPFSISILGIDHLASFNPGGASSLIDCHDANSITLPMPTLMEMGYNQFPSSNHVVELPNFWPGELGCDSVISSQEISSWNMELENVHCASWSTNGSVIQDEDGIFAEYGFETASELLNGIGFQEECTKVATFVQQADEL